MRYVCHHDFNDTDIRGQRVSVSRGEKLNCVGGFLTYAGFAVCAARSLAGKQHFARDDDGRGLERGNLTYAMAYAPRVRKGITDGRPARQRFTDDELEVLETRWEKYKKGVDFWLFNDQFFDEDVEILKEIAASVNITTAEAANV